MRIVPLDFCFKGDRDYVHGTDMYEKITDLLLQSYHMSRLSKFRIVIHRTARRNCSLLVSEAGQGAAPQDYVANFSLQGESSTLKGYLVEDDRAITCRYPYREEDLSQFLSVSENNVFLSGESPFSFIETIVAMNKYMHYRNYKDSGKWVFTRLDLSRMPEKPLGNGMALELSKNLNNLLTKSRIIYDNIEIGNIYFSQGV